MKDAIISAIKNKSFWTDLLAMYTFACLISLLQTKWYILLACSLIAAIGFFLAKGRDAKREKDISSSVIRNLKKAMKKSKREGDPYILYEAIDDSLPEMRKLLPNNLYKYFPLTDDEKQVEQKLNALQNEVIWASIPSQFNDPFEAQFTYLTPEDAKEMGFPDEICKVWEATTAGLRDRITTVCFTQNPNNIPMWAHYANNHQGFCVEYLVNDLHNFYPVIYTEKRIKAQTLLINLIYEIFCKDSTEKGKYLILKHFLLLSTFKDKSWEAENEVRAVLYNTTSLKEKKGRLISYGEIGVSATKVYIGVSCSKKNEERIIELCKQKGLSYEKCKAVTGEEYSVLGGEADA